MERSLAVVVITELRNKGGEIKGTGWDRRKCRGNNKPTRGVEYPMAKMLIRESIVSDNSSNGNGDEESKAGAQDPDDVLAFSRSVHKIDSSVLE
ncbi:hypothetical protein Peur_031350 [Populus x canadensis]